MAAPENINLKGLIPARMIAEQKPGKARSRALKKMLEAQKVLPAIRSAEGRVTRGLPGETHYDVIEREGRRRGLKLDKFEETDKLIDEYFQRKPGAEPGRIDTKTGFTEPRTGKYLTREEAGARTKTGSYGESMQIHKEQTKVPLRERLATTRRGEDPVASERLLKKRQQTGRLLSSLNERITQSSNNPSRLAALLNRKGLVKSIARKNKYLGLALASGEALKTYFNNPAE